MELKTAELLLVNLVLAVVLMMLKTDGRSFNLVRSMVLMVHMSSCLGWGFDGAHEPMGWRLRVLGKCEVCSVNG